MPRKIVFIYDFIKSRNGFLLPVGSVSFIQLFYQLRKNIYCFVFLLFCILAKSKAASGFTGWRFSLEAVIKKVDEFINKKNFTYEKREG